MRLGAGLYVFVHWSSSPNLAVPLWFVVQVLSCSLVLTLFVVLRSGKRPALRLPGTLAKEGLPKFKMALRAETQLKIARYHKF